MTYYTYENVSNNYFKILIIKQYNIQAPVSTLFPFPPQLFMFDFVSDRLLKISTRTHIHLAQTHSTIIPDAFYNHFSEMVKKDRIAPVVTFINSHNAIFRMFKEDFVKRTLHMHTMTSIWLDACVFILDGLCNSRGNVDVCCLYVAKVFLLNIDILIYVNNS